MIIGGSAAGVAAAFAMREAGLDGELVVVDADGNDPYERPPLSKSLIGTTDTALKPIVARQSFTDHDISLLLGCRVDRLDVVRHQVHLHDGTEIDADHVLLATGVRARRLAIPGADLDGTFVLRDAADAVSVSRHLSLGGPLVIVGAGFIGLELAALARAHGVGVTVVEVADLPLTHAVGPYVAQLLLRLHADHGVHFRLGTSVERFEGASAVEEVHLTDGARLAAGTVVVGVGVIPNDELAVGAGVITDGGVVVDSYGGTNVPWLSAAGDVAAQEHPSLASRSRIEHWDSAQRHGAAVGASVVGVPTVHDSVPYVWSDQYGLTFQAFGRPRATDEFTVRTGSRPDRFLAFWLREGRVGAVAGVGLPREVRAAKSLIEAGTSVSTVDLADPGTDMRRLLTRSALSRETPGRP